MREIGRGSRAFPAPPVQGTFVAATGVDGAGPVDGGAAGVVALVDDHALVELPRVAGSLVAVICTTGDGEAPLAVVSAERGVPCVLGVSFDGGSPPDGALVLVDCSGDEGRVAVVDGGVSDG